MLDKLRKIYNDYPRLFWIVVGTHFIDGLGGTLLFPFFALYITQKFNVGMTEAGVILGTSALFGLFGSMAGGALTDRFGRKTLIIGGLIFSAVTTLAFGLVPDIKFMYPLVAVVGLLGHIAGPAHNAMIADILPEEKRQEGFGILRVVGNLAWIIGPSIGGIIANYNFFLLFVIDSIISCIVALLLFRLLPETKPAAKVEAHTGQPESIWKTVLGYRVALKDLPFMAFLLASILMMIVYQQTYGSLSVYLRDVHGYGAERYGFMMTFGGLLVVLFQLSISRWLRKRPPFAMMALGTFLFMVNFTMYGLVSTYPLFLTVVAINAFGEMIIMPVSQGLAANFAPEDMRGRYMAVFGLSWSLPSTVGPGLAGYILDNYNPNLLWYIGGALCGVAALGFWLLHLKLGKREKFLPKLAEEVK